MSDLLHCWQLWSLADSQRAGAGAMGGSAWAGRLACDSLRWPTPGPAVSTENPGRADAGCCWSTWQEEAGYFQAAIKPRARRAKLSEQLEPQHSPTRYRPRLGHVQPLPDTHASTSSLLRDIAQLASRSSASSATLLASTVERGR